MKRESVYARLDQATLARVDALAEELSARAAGATINRSEALRILVERGLEAVAREQQSNAAH